MKWTSKIGLALVGGAFVGCSSGGGGGGAGLDGGAGTAAGGSGGTAASGGLGGSAAQGAFGGFGATGGVGAAGSGGVGAIGGSGGTAGGFGGSAGTSGTGGGPGSCQGQCGSSSPVGEPGCYCDTSCKSNGDCCGDYDTYCGGGAAKCQQFCCSSSDCPSGENCVAFDVANGTLGTCAVASGTGGTGGGTAPDAGVADGGTLGLPAGCVTSAVTVSCNPLNNSGCDTAGGEACDLGTNSSSQPELMCFPSGNTEPLGASCDNANGPWCQPTLHCVAN